MKFRVQISAMYKPGILPIPVTKPLRGLKGPCWSLVEQRKWETKVQGEILTHSKRQRATERDA